MERTHLPGLPAPTAAAAQEVVQLELYQSLHQAGGQRECSKLDAYINTNGGFKT